MLNFVFCVGSRPTLPFWSFLSHYDGYVMCFGIAVEFRRCNILYLWININKYVIYRNYLFTLPLYPKGVCLKMSHNCEFLSFTASLIQENTKISTWGAMAQLVKSCGMDYYGHIQTPFTSKILVFIYSCNERFVSLKSLYWWLLGHKHRVKYSC